MDTTDGPNLQLHKNRRSRLCFLQETINLISIQTFIDRRGNVLVLKRVYKTKRFTRETQCEGRSVNSPYRQHINPKAIPKEARTSKVSVEFLKRIAEAKGLFNY